MWCYERKKKKKEKEESRNQNSPKAFGELKTKIFFGEREFNSNATKLNHVQCSCDVNAPIPFFC